MDLVNRLMPNLRLSKWVNNYFGLATAGDELKLENYKNLKNVVQNSHVTIPGTIKFKHFMVYAQPSMTTNRFPQITEELLQTQFLMHDSQNKQTVSLTAYINFI